MSGEMTDLVERLRNPLWAHSKAPFESPQLDKEGALADMDEAATALEAKDKEIEALRGLYDATKAVVISTTARAETAERLVKAQRDFMKELSDALISIRPLGGSELFVKRFDEYFADPAYCKAAIKQQRDYFDEALKERVLANRARATAERELDTMNLNHRAMAKQLADLRRERDEARAQLLAFTGED